ncbi:hypothetical protein ACMATS_37895 (plasmid) [Streptoverticillium reticulum]|uniref:hypothetical protein n=1 Tax=Streptoverticillium reticulum TaxID=1433415 RepID=UPI0039BFF1D2
MTSRSRRSRIAQGAHYFVGLVVPAALAAGFIDLSLRVPDRVLRPVHLGGQDHHALVAVVTVAVLFGWWELAAPPLDRAIERRYLAGLPVREWLDHLGLTRAWQRPAPTPADFQRVHGESSTWSAIEFEQHQNLALGQAHPYQQPAVGPVPQRLALAPAPQYQNQEHHAG